MRQWIDRWVLLIPSDEKLLAMTEAERNEALERGFRLTRNVSIVATVLGLSAAVSSLCCLVR